MKGIFICAALLMASPAAFAQKADPNGPTRVRVWAPQMSCGALQESVERHGAVIVYRAPHLYERFVTNENYCESHEDAEWGYVATMDNDRCRAGFICRYDDDRGD